MSVPFDWAYRFRGVLMAPPYLFIVLAFFGETEHDLLLWPVGLTIFGLGVGIRIWAQMHLHYRLRIRKALTRTGPYVYVRNPIYIGNTLMLLGLTVVSELLWFLPVMLLWCMALYSFVVRREEAHLEDKYGEPYRQFLRDVPRWMPHRAPGVGYIAETAGLFWPSVRAELHCLLWLLPLIGKDLI